MEWLQAPEQTSLRRAFTVWLRRVLLPARFKGVEIPPVTELQEVKTMLAERVKEWTMEWKEEGLQQGLRQGLESERRMLGRLVKRRYGSGMFQTVSPLLGEIRELNLLEIAGEWVIEYDDGQVFFEKLKEAAGK
ncbi:hypothetical protein KJ965_04760 [Patescibacteria group bacterium]|nr:hypothetical protein [Patescibacteria group bacterium]